MSPGYGRPVRRLLLTATTTALLLLAGAQSAQATSCWYHGGCQKAAALRFVVEPASGQSGDVLTVKVAVVDKYGRRVEHSSARVTLALHTLYGSGTLSGTTTRYAHRGIAIFDDLRVTGAGTFRLVASSPWLKPATSAVFRIDTVAVRCAENAGCTAATSTGDTAASVTALGDPRRKDAGVLTLSFNSGPSLDCARYDEQSPDTALFDLRGGDRVKFARLTVDGSSSLRGYYGHGPKPLQLCFGAPRPFKTSGGGQATVGGSFDWNADGVPEKVFVGLLPDCGKWVSGPCIVKRRPHWGGGGTIEARIPLGYGDPAMRG
jgi:hypothetical protein